MKKFLILFALLLAGCDGKPSYVTPAHWNYASQKCSGVNGAVAYISSASKSPETVNCGYKCWKETGRIEYKEEFTCLSGAHFSVVFLE